ncbi:MFS transporter [Sediminibacillus halophilus]|uniref:MFS-type transporter involved in bile tolerance, Atg22 family n=1 Tax=Sediminibacillus halophilus TaxID=482461 RepID=A0A1G9LPX2_9BACI|nr:MFS transporter [Sediminibacillus halophilus]SDL63973.1 MFS-type transporter involved in bile tolerance, Atg22 family [Sediminibacillus halophilus]
MYTLLKQNRNFCYYLIGGGISRLGDILSGLAFLFLAHDLTGSGIHTTGMAIAETMPYLFFGLVGGVIADWLPRKRLLISLDLIRFPLILSIVLLDTIGSLTYPYLLIVSFLIQTVGCFFNPAHRAILPLITNKDELTAANSLQDSITRGITVLSPLITVFLIQTFGVIHFFTIDAVTYLIGILCLIRVYVKETKKDSNKSVQQLFSTILAFFVWAKQHVIIRQVFFFTFLTVFFNTWVWEIGLLLGLAELTSNEQSIYSILQGMFGGVVIITNLILPYFIKKMTLKTYLTGSAIWGSGITYYGILFDVEHFYIGCAIVGIGLPIAGLARVYLLQSLVPEEKLGRAFSFNAVLLYLANTISLALFGILSAYIPIRFLMTGCGVAILLTSLTFLLIKTVGCSGLRRSRPIDFFK